MPACAKHLIAWTRRRFTSHWHSNWPLLIHSAWHTYSLPVCAHSSIDFSNTSVKWCAGGDIVVELTCVLLWSLSLFSYLLTHLLAQMESKRDWTSVKMGFEAVIGNRNGLSAAENSRSWWAHCLAAVFFAVGWRRQEAGFNPRCTPRWSG